MLKEFAPSLFTVDGPTVPFFGFPYPTRMALVRLASGDVWVWSPIALTPELAAATEAIGPVRCIVAPNKLHHLFLQQWIDRWPEARVYAPPGLARKKPAIRFDAELRADPDPLWAADIDQVIFRGSFFMEEVVFWHRPSRTVLIADLIQRHPEATLTGFKGMLMRLDGLAGKAGSTPRDWRATFLKRKPARAARDKVLSWHAQRLLIAHGECAASGADEIIAKALQWL